MNTTAPRLALVPAVLVVLANLLMATLLSGGSEPRATRWGEGGSTRLTTISPACDERAFPPTDSWQQAITEDIGAREYHVSVSAGGLQAPNRAQDLRTTFKESKIAIRPRRAPAARPPAPQPWCFELELARFGRPNAMQVPGAAVPRAGGARVVYERPEIREWYENRPEGIEQGFDIPSAPRGDGPIRIEAKVAGGLVPEWRDGAIDLFDDHHAQVLTYGALSAFDRMGRSLPSRLGLEGNVFVIEVEDAGAHYPITIDPLLTTPSWTAELNRANETFGQPVATAGDVNGDGYSDVIAGALYYDNGEQDEGRVFLYLGSAQGLATTPAWTAESNQAECLFGVSIGTAGDVNRDGYSDVIIGAKDYSNGQLQEGRAYVYLGSASGLAATPIWTRESNQTFGGFGNAVGTAGDFNGDHYSDIIVTAVGYSNGQVGEGRAFVYLGTPQGVAATPFWTGESNQEGSGYGWSCGTAGDVNGDGFSDVIVGAQAFSNGQSGEGRAFLYLGSVLGPSPTPSWTAESNQAGAGMGNSVATAGDVNGDGYADVIVGAWGYANGQTREGRAFVYHGSATGPALLPSWTAESDWANASFGYSVATAGDVNGDGYADVIIGSPSQYQGPNEENREGLAFVYLGSFTGLPYYPAWTGQLNQAEAFFGQSVGTAGDVNGDGYSDIIVGAPEYDHGELDEGMVFVFHGSAWGLNPIATFNASAFQTEAWFGASVASAGDVDGDGYSDFIAGAPNYDGGHTDEGRAYIFYGDDGGYAAPEADQDFAYFGTSVASAGDVNGDGFADVIVGAPQYDNGQDGEGRAYVFLGSAAGTVVTPAWTAESNQLFAAFGTAVAWAGDVNGDGYGDVVVGAPNFSNGEDSEGRVFIYHGSSTGLPTAPARTLESNQASSGFGSAVACAGDVNRDGFSDVIVGASFFDNGENGEGRAFIYHGSATGLAASPARTLESNQIQANFGVSVATAGDVNGDGYSDVIIGADGYDNGQSDEGRAFIYLGSSQGVAAAPAWNAEPNVNFAQFGYSVATAGDVNADGYSDVIVGAPNYTNDQDNEGAAFAYWGAASAMSAQPIWATEGDQNLAAAGFSVAGGVDLVGDGFADVLVGMPYYNTRAFDRTGWCSGFQGNLRTSDNPGPRLQQARVGDPALIHALGNSNYRDSFRLQAIGTTAAGRGRVWLEWEVKTLGTPFNGQGIGVGRAFDTGAPDPLLGSEVPLTDTVFGLQNGQRYCWRARIASSSPLFPRTPWFSLPNNASTETDLRTMGLAIAVEETAPAVPGFALERVSPNPFRSPGEIAYVLASRASVRLAIYDVQGRVRVLLDDGMKEAGRHTAPWDGRETTGKRLGAGVYFVRLAVGDRIESQKLTIAP